MGLAFVKRVDLRLNILTTKNKTIKNKTTTNNKTTTEHKGTFEGDECVHHLDCGDGNTNVYKYLNSLNCGH